MSERLQPDQNEFDKTDPEESERTDWWSELKPDESVYAAIKVKKEKAPSGDKSLNRSELRAKSIKENQEAIENIVSFMNSAPEFSDFDFDSVTKYSPMGMLFMSLTKDQCSALMESGLVESISHNEELSGVKEI